MTRTKALLIALALTTAACTAGAPSGGTGATTSVPPAASPGDSGGVAGSASFPVTVRDDRGEVTIEARPEAIVSLSTTGTEMLFAVGAGDQVVAVDEYSIYPEEAPVTDLSGFTPNVEAVLSYAPDLVVLSFDPGGLLDSLDAVGVPGLILMTAADLDDSYRQLETIGMATGHADEAAGVVEQMKEQIGTIVETSQSAEGITFFHEVDSSLYSASSASFLGQIYGLFGLENIADQAEDPGGMGFPQLSSEYIVTSDPDIIFLGDVDFGVTPESVAERPGWSGLTAVRTGALVGLDSYLASNWGPRVVELLEVIAGSIAEHAPAS